MSGATRRLRSLSDRMRALLGGAADVDGFLDEARGVVHVGANTGQEREAYAALGLPVLWVEPIPAVFAELERNIAGLPDQRAVRALLTERSGERVTLHIANNNGESSSILELARHRELWPEVDYEDAIELETETLASVLDGLAADAQRFDTLVLDTQGSELRVLQGAGPWLQRFRWIKTEAADFEAYRGGCTIDELGGYLGERGFREHLRVRFEGRRGVGSYFDVVYRRAGGGL